MAKNAVKHRKSRTRNIRQRRREGHRKPGRQRNVRDYACKVFQKSATRRKMLEYETMERNRGPKEEDTIKEERTNSRREGARSKEQR
jgi:hypothetical protein